jgi:hypothetical protein
VKEELKKRLGAQSVLLNGQGSSPFKIGSKVDDLYAAANTFKRCLANPRKMPLPIPTSVASGQFLTYNYNLVASVSQTPASSDLHRVRVDLLTEGGCRHLFRTLYPLFLPSLSDGSLP